MTVTTLELRRANVPERFWELQTDTYFGSNESLRLLFVDYLTELPRRRKDGEGLFIQGPPLSLKTFLATLTLKIALAKGFTAYYFSLVSDYSIFFNETEKNSATKKKLLESDFLVIDNVGATENRGQQSVLQQIIRPRADRNLPTIIVTNLKDGEFRSNYGAELAALIADRCQRLATFPAKRKINEVEDGEDIDLKPDAH